MTLPHNRGHCPANPAKNQRGFTLVEIMITLLLGVILSGAIVQVMVSNNVTEKLNRAMASAQENGRFIVSRLRADLLMTGRYDVLSERLNRDVDIVEEAAFVVAHPVPLAGDFSTKQDLGALQGASGGNDTLVVALQAERDCRGYKLGYDNNEEFFVVNQYFVDGLSLKCRGFDGRVLRGRKAAEGTNGDAAFTLLDNVHSFQVMYGVTNITSVETARPLRYVTADELAAEYASGSQVVSIRIAVLVEGDGEVVIEPTPSFKLLNEAAVSPSGKRLYKQFETTITLRNVKNFLRSTAV